MATDDEKDEEDVDEESEADLDAEDSDEESDASEESDESGKSEPREPAPSGEYAPTQEELAEIERQRIESEQRYFNLTRSLSVSVLFVLPLLVIYELGVLFGGNDINAAAALMKAPISWLENHPTQVLGVNGMLLLNAVLIVCALVAVWRASRRNALRLSPYLWMFCESGIYALLLGPLALAPITGGLQFGGVTPNQSSFLEAIVVGAGAGLYEEAFFRLMILGTIFYLAKELGGMRAFGAGLLALFISGVLFSAAHFLSGEPPQLGPFIYRLSAGMLLGLIYMTRGFGIAAWTHALYDIYVICFVMP